MFIELINKEKVFICANPDEVVSRGDKIEFCAGALAKYFKKLGGKVKYFGKPFVDITIMLKIKSINKLVQF